MSDRLAMTAALYALLLAGWVALAAVLGRTPGPRLIAGLVLLELTLLAIGTASLAWPDAFPDETVWSAYGQGYGFLPLVLPIAGLAWLRSRAACVGSADAASERLGAGRAPSEAVAR